jgi:GNAT superfamily N-acetyltransferase
MTSGPDLKASLASRLAKALPDTPAWVDIRGMLFTGRAEVMGGQTVEEGFVVRALSGALAVVGVVGRPPHDAIARAVADATDMTPVIAQRENADHVGAALASCPASTANIGWQPEPVIMHVLTAPPTSEPDVAVPEGDSDAVTVRLLDANDSLDHLSPELRFEMSHARAKAPVAVAVIHDRPVAFCYPCWITETLWDVSIDTLEPYRRRGLAARVAQFMVALMKERGREPVWAAMASNTASLELARRLGFTPVDEVVVFSRGPWAYLTRGFQAPTA